MSTLLAIDPGTRRHGWCLLSREGSGPVEPVYWGHDDIDRVLREVQTASLVVIETPGGYAYSAARVSGLLETAHSAGLLHGVAVTSGARVSRCTAETWRRALTGSGQASDGAIETALTRYVAAGQLARLPETRLRAELAHVLDACGLGLVALTRGLDWIDARERERVERAIASRGAQPALPGLGAKRRRRA